MNRVKGATLAAKMFINLLFCACFYDGFINSNFLLMTGWEVISHPKEVYSDSRLGVVRFALLKGWNDLASYNKLLNLDTKIEKEAFILHLIEPKTRTLGVCRVGFFILNDTMMPSLANVAVEEP